MKTCPFCKERIDADALRCRHCQSNFDEAQMQSGRNEHRGTFGRGILLLVVAIVLFAFWASQPGNMTRLAEAEAGLQGTEE